MLWLALEQATITCIQPPLSAKDSVPSIPSGGGQLKLLSNLRDELFASLLIVLISEALRQ